jgi:putative spermidine/putrescine transport system permease protein
VSLEARARGGWGLTVYFWIVIVYLLLPILIIVPTSFSAQDFLRFPPGRLGLRWYVEYFSSEPWLAATLRSVRIALAAAILATLCGSLAAIALERGRPPARALLSAMFAAPAIVPHIILALGLFIVAVWLGLNGVEFVLVLAHAAIGIPFAVLIVSSVLRQIDPTIERAARVLGAGPVRSFFAATFPSLLPAIVSTAIFAFFISFDELIIALFLMGQKQTLPVRIWTDLRFELSPTIAPISTLMVVVTTVAMGAAEILRRRTARLQATPAQD